MDFTQYLGSFDIHSYQGIYTRANETKTISDWVEFAKLQNKPFFISEFGNMTIGWGTDNPGPKSFKAALSNASDVALGMNLGVDGFNRWSFTNRGDMDGQWQLVNTYDLKTKTYTKVITPENEAYYGFAMLTRFMGKYASVLTLKSDRNIDGLVLTAYKNRDGNLSVLLVNNSKNVTNVGLSIDNFDNKKLFNLYQVTENLLKAADFKLDPIIVFKNSGKLKNIRLLPESISIITTNGLRNEDFGVIE
jgi:hypothetical protein